MTGRAKLETLERVAIARAEDLRAWLAHHHARRESVWIVTAKKGSGLPHVPWSDIVDEALCFGWIDSLPRKLDETRTMLLLSPRKPGSGWSKVNKEKVARLAAEGRLAPSGVAAVDRAKANGAWSKLDAVDALEEPSDLTLALNAVPRARAAFDAFPRSARRGILEWIVQAKRPDTRATRIATTVAMAEKGERANQPTSRLRRPSSTMR